MTWLRRLIRCGGGRYCANIVPTEIDQLPPGAFVRIVYRCGGCGTFYVYDGRDGQRHRLKDAPDDIGGIELGPSGIDLAAGESAAFNYQWFQGPS